MTPHRRVRVPALSRALLGSSMAALLLVGGIHGPALTSETLSDDVATLTVPFVVEGRSLASWAGQAMALSRAVTSDAPACEVDPAGHVAMLLRHGQRCVVSAGQSIFVPVVSRSCEADENLAARATRARGKRADRLARRVDAQAAGLYRCLHEQLDLLRSPYLSIDGVEVDVDRNWFVISEPISEDGVTERWPGYFVMLAPLSPGTHTIVTGHGFFPGSPLRVETTVEVVASDAG